MEGGHLQESKHRGYLPRRGPGTSTFWQIILWLPMSKLGYVYFHVVTKVFRIFSGCKESQFYSLPFGQAVASMY